MPAERTPTSKRFFRDADALHEASKGSSGKWPQSCSSGHRTTAVGGVDQSRSSGVRDYGAVLIFDEIKTGSAFVRAATRSMQASPLTATFGKAMRMDFRSRCCREARCDGCRRSTWFPPLSPAKVRAAAAGAVSIGMSGQSK